MQLKVLLAAGIPEDAVAHARFVAEVAAILHEAFDAVSIRWTLVGGGAIEIHAPGIYKSGDVDVVLEHLHDALADSSEVFEALGFTRRGRHWLLGDLMVEIPPMASRPSTCSPRSGTNWTCSGCKRTLRRSMRGMRLSNYRSSPAARHRYLMTPLDVWLEGCSGRRGEPCRHARARCARMR
jgi:hypothetical protein